MRELHISIGADGKVHMDAQGFTGNTCEQATSELQRVLAGTTTKDEKKPEYYQSGSQADLNKMRF